MTASTDMSTPVTRGELRAEIEQLEVRLDQRFEQVDQRFEQVDQRFEQVDQRFEQLEQKLEQKLAPLATKAELAHFATKADLERFATKAELERFATKAELEAWGLALLDRMQTEIARHYGALQEWMSAQFSVFDEKYTDLPGRVNRLEATVFGPRQR